MQFAFRLALLWLLVAIAAGPLFAQTSSGTIIGHVIDQTGSNIANADVVLTNSLTHDSIRRKVDSSGDFVFADVRPGTYFVVVRSSGFKELRKDNVILAASQRLSIGQFQLQVGAVDQTITVAADVTPLQLTSAERSGTIDSKQTDNLLAVGRDALALVRVMPGVVGSEGNNSLSQSTSPTINGVRSEYTNLTVDGVNGKSTNLLVTPPNLDAISEVTVLTANYQAEYGKNAGAVINIVTKGGTNQFHGVGYYYARNEAFNANSYFNNLNGLPRARYRYNTFGGNVGGPIYWPGKFNSAKDKLFFFVSAEYIPITVPDGIRYYTVPTALERQGDFSQTLTVGGKLIPIIDPSTGQQFPGNKIPSARINSNTQALLNIYPLPNFTNRAVSGGNYNYVTNYSSSQPVNQQIVRIDYNASEKLHIYGRWQQQSVSQTGYLTSQGRNAWLNPSTQVTTGPNDFVNVTYSASPTLVNELLVSFSGFDQQTTLTQSSLEKIQKSTTGYNLGQLHPTNNPLNLIPAASFGAPNSADIGYYTKYPFSGTNYNYSLTDGLTKVWGQHTIKVGGDLQLSNFSQPNHGGSGVGPGSFSFAPNSSNPNNSGYGYSNALLGNFNTYSEPTNLTQYYPTTKSVEWYGQDQWRATRKLTLDYGVRFTWALAQTLKQGGNFVPDKYVAANAPTLYQYAKVGGKAVAVDPRTSQVYPLAYAGLFVPNTGNPFNGAIAAGTAGYPKGLVYGNGVILAPRVGFAYDPFGTGKTSVRGGFGIFYNARNRDGQEGNMSFNPPAISYPQQFYGNVDTFLNAGNLLGPISMNTVIEQHPHVLSTLNMSLGVQRQLPAGVVLDVAYVGTLGRHLSGLTQVNEVPFGAQFLPQNQNPAGGVLPDNFFRPYPGYADIPTVRFNLNSSYHSLQTQVTRRFSHGLEFGAAYTWSKAMDYTDTWNGTVATYVPIRIYNYGPAGYDRRNNLTANFLWSLPKGSRLWNTSVSRTILDNWQISGIASFISGAPMPLAFTTTNSLNITGGGDPARLRLTGNPQLGGKRSFGQWFNTSVINEPLVGTQGNAPYAPFVGPGTNNWDTALFKNVPIKDRLVFQLRIETYNTFNHTQFAGVNTTATFDATGQQVNAKFGSISSTAPPRIMQVAGRLSF